MSARVSSRPIQRRSFAIPEFDVVIEVMGGLVAGRAIWSSAPSSAD